MADSAPAPARGPQSVAAPQPSAMRRARDPPAARLPLQRIRADTALTIALFASLLLTLATCQSQSRQQLFVVCKNPNWNIECVTRPLDSLERALDIMMDYQVEDNISCGISDLETILSHPNIMAVRQFNDVSKIFYCNSAFTKTENVIRPRRQTEYKLRGRYRGQTQSQYLSIDRGNGKDEGKAEAHSAADSSRAIVSGNSGMGQAQSQTIYDPSCEDCIGPPGQSGLNSIRGPSQPNNGHGLYSPGQIHNYGNQQRTPNENYINVPGGSYGQRGANPSQHPGTGPPNENSRGTQSLTPENIVSHPGPLNNFPNKGSSNQPYGNTGLQNGGSPSNQGGVPSNYNQVGRPGQSGVIPGNGGIPQNQGGMPLNQGGMLPGQGGPQNQGGMPFNQGGLSPNQGRTVSGQGGIPQNQIGIDLGRVPLDQNGNRPGQGGVPLDQGGKIPGQNGIFPGHGGLLPGGGVLTPGQGGTAPGQGGFIPNQGGMIPGQGGMIPGQGGMIPGQGGMLPGQGGMIPGQGGLLPGQGGMMPGQEGLLPGQGGMIPGQGGMLPGQRGMIPGQGGLLPGQGGMIPGQGGMLPGQGRIIPGQGGIMPGQGGITPGQGGLIPVQGGTRPGQGGMLPNQSSRVPGQSGYVPGQTGIAPNQGGIPENQGSVNYPQNSGGGGGNGGEGPFGWSVMNNLLREKGVVCCFAPDSQNLQGLGNIFNRQPYSSETNGQVSGTPDSFNNGRPYGTGPPGENYLGYDTVRGNNKPPYGSFEQKTATGPSGHENYHSPNGQHIGSGHNIQFPSGSYPGQGQSGRTPSGQYSGQSPNGQFPIGSDTSIGQNGQASTGPYTGAGQGGQLPPASYTGLSQNGQFPTGLYTGAGQDGQSGSRPTGSYTGSGPNGQSFSGPYEGLRQNVHTGLGQNGQSPTGPYTGSGQNGQQPSGLYTGPYTGHGQSGPLPPGTYTGSGQIGSTPSEYIGTGQNGQSPVGENTGADQNRNSFSRPYTGSGQTGQFPSGPITGSGQGGQLPSGSYTGAGQNGQQTPTGPYTGLGQNGQSPSGPYTGTGQNGQSPTGPYTGSGQNGQFPTGTYTGLGQNGQSPTRPYTGSSQNGQQPSGPYTGAGQSGQSSSGPYPGTGQNGQSPTGPYTGTGQTGQSSTGPYTSLGQNGQHPSGPFTGSGQSGQFPTGTYTGLGQNGQSPTRPYTGSSQNGQQPSGPYTGAGQSGQSSSGPYPGTGQNGRSPTGPYTGTGPTGQSSTGPYTGTGQNGQSSTGPYTGTGQNGQSSTGPYTGTGQNALSPPGPYTGLGQNIVGQNGQNSAGPYTGSGPSVQGPYTRTGQNSYQLGINGQLAPQGFNNQGNAAPNKEYGGEPQNVLDPNSISSTLDDYDSQAQASVSQAVNGTTALASSKGGNEKGRAQTQVEGTYTGTGSFSANAEISDDIKAAQSHVSGSKKGASGSAEGRGRKNKSQASVELGSETGSILTDSQSSGDLHSSSSQVQGSVKGGMADAQAKGPGSTSSQAQIGFTPYKDQDKDKHDLLKVPFEGGGTASAQSSGRMGTSQSQLRGTFKYGITYNGAAQAGSSIDKDAVFSNLLPFDKIDVYDENNKNINIDISTTELPEDVTVSLTENNGASTTAKIENDHSINTDEASLDHNHSDHHKQNNQFYTTDHPLPLDNPLEGNLPNPPSENPKIENPSIGNTRSFHNKYDGTSANGVDYEYTVDKDMPEEYDTDDGFGSDGAENTPGEQGEYANYDDIAKDAEATHQSLQNTNTKSYEIKQTTGGNTQHIILGSLNNHDAKIIQRNSEHPDEKRIYQPGERVPGMGGYTIPAGFTGSVKSVASKDKTYVVGTKYSPSQAQTVKLTPGTGNVKYVNPGNYGQNVNSKDLRSLRNYKPDDRYVSVSKSVTRDLDSENNIRKQYSHTYYTKSSSCGYFTFTCTMVSSSEGKKKVCKPKIPTNPDGTPMRC